MAKRASEATATAADYASLFLRAPLGVLFIWSGVQRLLTETATASAIVAPDSPLAALTPEVLNTSVAVLPYVQIAIGALFCLGLFARVAAVLCVICLLYLCMLFGWGEADSPFSPRLIYLSVAAAVLLLGSGMVSADFIVFGDRRTRKR